jgi:GTP-binding protein HflX
VWISAAHGLGLDLLGRAVAERLSRAVHRMRLQLPLSEGAARARLYAAGVVRNEQPSMEAFDLTVDLPDSELAALARMAGAKLVPAGGDTLESPGKTHRRPSGLR